MMSCEKDNSSFFEKTEIIKILELLIAQATKEGQNVDTSILEKLKKELDPEKQITYLELFKVLQLNPLVKYASKVADANYKKAKAKTIFCCIPQGCLHVFRNGAAQDKLI